MHKGNVMSKDIIKKGDNYIIYKTVAPGFKFLLYIGLLYGIGGLIYLVYFSQYFWTQSSFIINLSLLIMIGGILGFLYPFISASLMKKRKQPHIRLTKKGLYFRPGFYHNQEKFYPWANLKKGEILFVYYTKYGMWVLRLYTKTSHFDIKERNLPIELHKLAKLIKKYKPSIKIT